MTFHIIIRQERRTQPERMAIPIGTSVPTGNTIQGPMGDMPEYVAGPVQLHTHNDKIVRVDGVMHVWRKIDGEDALVPWAFQDDPQVVAVFEWDGNPNYIIQHKGDYSARTMGYAGWPELTKEQYDALPAADLPL